jgi:hypothetical protein
MSLRQLILNDIQTLINKIVNEEEEFRSLYNIFKRCKKQQTIDRYIRFMNMSKEIINEYKEQIEKLETFLKIISFDSS